MVSRERQRRFWLLVSGGSSIRAAAVLVGVEETLGRTWFVQAGGVNPRLCEPGRRFLSFAEREQIAIWRAERVSMREIGRRLGRAGSTVSRELERGRRTKSRPYLASVAQGRADARARRPQVSKLAANPALAQYVQAQLSSRARWSPEQISRRIRIDHRDDERMRISHETIYRALYVQGRGELRRDLHRCLRTGRAVRRPARIKDGRVQRVPKSLLISQRPAEVADRAVPGHWEGDLIVGTGNRSAIGTLVERSTRFVMLLHLPGDHGADQVREAITETITTLPTQLRRSLTWDQGVEMVAAHLNVRIDTGLEVYFCDPHSPWQRGTNENTNGLLRQYFPTCMRSAVSRSG